MVSMLEVVSDQALRAQPTIALNTDELQWLSRMTLLLALIEDRESRISKFITSQPTVLDARSEFKSQLVSRFDPLLIIDQVMLGKHH